MADGLRWAIRQAIGDWLGRGYPDRATFESRRADELAERINEALFGLDPAEERAIEEWATEEWARRESVRTELEALRAEVRRSGLALAITGDDSEYSVVPDQEPLARDLPRIRDLLLGAGAETP